MGASRRSMPSSMTSRFTAKSGRHSRRPLQVQDAFIVDSVTNRGFGIAKLGRSGAAPLRERGVLTDREPANERLWVVAERRGELR